MHPTDRAYLVRKLADIRTTIAGNVTDLEMVIRDQTESLLAGGDVPGKLHVYINELREWRALASRVPSEVTSPDLVAGLEMVAHYLRLVENMPARRACGDFGTELRAA